MAKHEPTVETPETAWATAEPADTPSSSMEKPSPTTERRSRRTLHIRRELGSRVRNDGLAAKALPYPHPVPETVETVVLRKRVFVSGTRFFDARERRDENEERAFGQMEIRHDLVDGMEFRTRHEEELCRSGYAR